MTAQVAEEASSNDKEPRVSQSVEKTKKRRKALVASCQINVAETTQTILVVKVGFSLSVITFVLYRCSVLENAGRFPEELPG